MEIDEVNSYLEDRYLEKLEYRIPDEEVREGVINGIGIISRARAQTRGDDRIFQDDVEWCLDFICVIWPWKLGWERYEKEFIEEIREIIFGDVREEDDFQASIPSEIFNEQQPTLLDLLVPHPLDIDDPTAEPPPSNNPLLVSIDTLFKKCGYPEARDYLEYITEQ